MDQDQNEKLMKQQEQDSKMVEIKALIEDISLIQESKMNENKKMQETMEEAIKMLINQLEIKKKSKRRQGG